MDLFNKNRPLPTALKRSTLEDFKMKGATGISPMYQHGETLKFGFFPMDDNLIRFFGGTESPNSTIPGYIQSLMWMADKGYPLPPAAALCYRVLHRLNIAKAPIAKGNGLKDICHREEHGIIPVPASFAKNHPDIVWVWLEFGKLVSSVPNVRWVNGGVAHIAQNLIRDVSQANGDVAAITARQDAFILNVFEGRTYALNDVITLHDSSKAS